MSDVHANNVSHLLSLHICIVSLVVGSCSGKYSFYFTQYPVRGVVHCMDSPVGGVHRMKVLR